MDHLPDRLPSEEETACADDHDFRVLYVVAHLIPRFMVGLVVTRNCHSPWAGGAAAVSTIRTSDSPQMPPMRSSVMGMISDEAEKTLAS